MNLLAAFIFIPVYAFRLIKRRCYGARSPQYGRFLSTTVYQGLAYGIEYLPFLKRWYVLRMVPLDFSQIQMFQWFGNAFLNGYCFPRIRFETLSLPGRDNGANILDLHVQ
ncbi:hypothetical protein AB4K20DRAFT_1869360 [Rhizopus microsporus]|uniref:Uncharacterized protein n=1 Tax=Rhizopus microsporus TaxID=58291 RepID=A0A1X0SAH2_RHIZD|nr:hypothetical protein BCV71DRAFT_232416 [Rhizopus microsporus]